MKPINQLSREELYELVWSEAMQTLAPKFNLSNVGLKKRCQAQGIPTPPRGYWAKLEAGKPAKKEPLPQTWIVGYPKKPHLPKSPDEVRRFTPASMEYPIEGFTKSAAQALKHLRKLKPSSDGLVQVRGSGILSINVSPTYQERAAWLWSQFMTALSAQSLKLVTTGVCSITDGTETVTFELRELLTRYERPYDPKIDQRPIWGDPPKMVKLFTPTGFLAFRAEEIYGAGCTREWKDSQLNPLDGRIQEIAEGVEKLLKRKHEMGIEREAARRRAEEEHRKDQIERERQRYEDERQEKLLEFVKQFNKAEEIRRFVQSILASDESGSMTGFCAWALGVADELDPIPEIKDKIAAGQDPVEPDFWYSSYYQVE